MSDIHLGSTLSARLGLPKEKHETYRKDFRVSIKKAFEIAQTEAVDVVMLPGDLFDDEAVPQDDVNFLIARLAELSPTPVFIAPGNHDFYSSTSPYHRGLLSVRNQPIWSENVFIFTDDAYTYMQLPARDDVIVIGRAFHHNEKITECLLTEPFRLDSKQLNLLLFHGSRLSGPPASDFITAPFEDVELLQHRFDYAAIGHYHTNSVIADSVIKDADGIVRAAYSGCLVGRNLNETGDKYILIGEVVKEGTQSNVTVQSARVSHRSIRVVPVQITTEKDSDSVLATVESHVRRSVSKSDDIVYVQVNGRLPPGVEVTTPKDFLSEYFHVRVDYSGLEPEYNLEEYLRDDIVARTTEARFVRRMWERLQRERDAERKMILQQALYYGLDALRLGKVVQRDVVETDFP